MATPRIILKNILNPLADAIKRHGVKPSVLCPSKLQLDTKAACVSMWFLDPPAVGGVYTHMHVRTSGSAAELQPTTPASQEAIAAGTELPEVRPSQAQ